MAKDINVKITGDESDLNRALRSAGKSSSKAGKAISTGIRAGALAAGAAIAGLAVGAAKSVEAASDLEESMNAIRVVFGKATKTIVDFGKTSAESVGLSQRAFNQAVTPIGAALQNVGLAEQEAADQAINLTQRAADMASVFNTDVSTALEAIQAALRGEADPIERFGIGLSDAAVQAQAVKMGMEKLDGQFTAGQKVRARLALFFQQSNRFAGDFANTSGGLANQQRILRARFEDIAAAIGTKLLPVLTDAAEKVSDLLDFLGKIGRQKTVMAKIKVVWAGVRGVAADLFEQLRGALFGYMETKTIRMPIGKAEVESTWHQGLITSIAAGLAGADWTAIGQQVGAGISQAIEFTADWVASFLESVEANIDKIADVGAQIALTIIGKLTDPAFWKEHPELLLLVASLFPFAKMGAIGGKIAGPIVRGIARVLPAGVRRVADEVFAIFRGLWERLPGPVRTVIGTVLRLAGRLVAWINGSLKSALGKVPGWVRTAFRFAAIVTFISWINTAIRAVQDLIDWLGRIGSAVPDLPGWLPDPRNFLPGNQLAEGGIVRRPTVALIGERGPEAVIPLSRAGSMGGPQTINLILDGAVVARSVRLHDGRWAMQNG